MVVGVEDKTIIATVAISAVTILQVVAWYCGFNGQVFALTSAVIGGITGFTFGLKKGSNGQVSWVTHTKTTEELNGSN